MTFLEKFLQVFKDDWLILKEPNLKNPQYIKFLHFNNRYFELGSNVPVILVDYRFRLKNKPWIDPTCSFYGLFQKCKLVEDEEILDKLKNLEAKYLLLK